MAVRDVGSGDIAGDQQPDFALHRRVQLPYNDACISAHVSASRIGDDQFRPVNVKRSEGCIRECPPVRAIPYVVEYQKSTIRRTLRAFTQDQDLCSSMNNDSSSEA